MDVMSTFKRYLQRAAEGSCGAPWLGVSVQSNSEGRTERERGGCVVRRGRGDRRDGSDMLCHLGQVGTWPRGASEL